MACSLCDRCTNPGRCCTGFTLWTRGPAGAVPVFTASNSVLEVAAGLAQRSYFTAAGAHTIGLPFLPLWLAPDGDWKFWCPVLGRDGRCGDHANRPALCASFQPGSDALCCMPPDPIDYSVATVTFVGDDVPDDVAPTPAPMECLDAAQ